MSDHHHIREVCSCGAILGQCKCPAPKVDTIIRDGCADCKKRVETVEPYVLAEIAYNAYCAHTGGKSIVTGDTLPTFLMLRDAIKDAWAASGLALKRHILAVEDKQRSK